MGNQERKRPPKGAMDEVAQEVEKSDLKERIKEMDLTNIEERKEVIKEILDDSLVKKLGDGLQTLATEPEVRGALQNTKNQDKTDMDLERVRNQLKNKAETLGLVEFEEKEHERETTLPEVDFTKSQRDIVKDYLRAAANDLGYDIDINDFNLNEPTIAGPVRTAKGSDEVSKDLQRTIYKNAKKLVKSKGRSKAA